MKICAILVAAGKGERMSSQIPKSFIMINNHPLIYYPLKILSESISIDYIILVVPQDDIAYTQREIVEKYRFIKVNEVIPGGEQRQDSVYNGLRKVLPETELVLIHDGARPFITQRLIDETIAEARQTGGAIPGVTPVDTIKSINGGEWIEETWDRDSLVMIQTPQVFKYDLIRDAYEKAYQDNFYATDDALLIRRLGGKVKWVKGDYENIKITVPQDILVAKAILKDRKIRGNGHASAGHKGG
ncbi:MAG: 2-C-methyl-D-erythritol 4-phosphate cytidylyltransferase [bacterium]